MLFLEQKNFIDFATVKDEPIESLVQLKFAQALDPKLNVQKQVKYTEMRVTLQDSLWQYFVEPNELSFLTPSEQIGEGITNHGYVQVMINIDTKVQISQRTVNDIVTLFGDIGGFSGFLMTCLSLLIGTFPAKLFDISKAEELFYTQGLEREAEQQGTDRRERQLSWFLSLKRVSITRWQKAKTLLGYFGFFTGRRDK